jgi:DNA/RNA endonuclease G (NUC1)
LHAACHTDSGTFYYLRRMLRYITIALFVLSFISCKKDSVAPPTVTPPVDTSGTAAVFTYTNTAGLCFTSNVQGDYATGTALTSANKVSIQVNVSRKGTYSISTVVLNGIKFTASGTFATTGVQSIILQGVGVPAMATTIYYTYTGGTSTCGFTIMVAPTVTIGTDNDHMFFGNPSNAVASLDSTTNFLMRKTYYSVSYSSERGIPNWVSWHLFSADFGGTPRQDDFRADINLPSSWYWVEPTAYSSTGFNKGHNVPSSDRTSTQEANSSTFLMTNMIPQAPNHNQFIWARFEDSLRRLVNQGNEIYIIMGNYGEGGVGSSGPATTIDGGRVTVPASIWKIAVVIPNGNDDLTRVSAATRVIAIDAANINTVGTNWKNYRVSVDAIEAATGYNLLSRIDEALQNQLEARVDNL